MLRSACLRQLTIAILLIFICASVLIPEDNQNCLASMPACALSNGYFDDRADDKHPCSSEDSVYVPVIHISCLFVIREFPVIYRHDEEFKPLSFILHLSHSDRAPPAIA